ncbi:hypothetical protein, partial [Microcoleus sp. OTE_8_concoct_300]|uniref:hypothetical protein n=1 Tax=Microcoleus sp. OTE_8_concoct_300 TaxID=2964710 RepID=UPI00403F4EE2
LRFNIWSIDNIPPRAKITRRGNLPIPQKKITLGGWASCPSHQLMKRTFARGLLDKMSILYQKLDPLQTSATVA